MTTGLIWTQPAWLETAYTWIDEQLARLGHTKIGEMEQFHIRPWSTVMRIPTSGGLFYFKAVTPRLDHEMPITEVLSKYQPDKVTQVFAVDTERGWLMMPDAGLPLRPMIQLPADLHHWETVVALYADLQKAMIPHGEELLNAGILDRRLARLPELYANVIADRPAMLIGEEDGITEEVYAKLQSLTPTVQQMCAELASYGLPETIHHDDFHDNNIFVKDGYYRLSDWGDSCWTHPFFTLMIGFRVVAHYHKVEPQGTEITRLRDTYLAKWGDYASQERLLAAFKLAQPLAMICRALTYYHFVPSLPEPHNRKEMDGVSGWLQDFTEALQ